MNRLFDIVLLMALIVGVAGISVSENKIYVILSCFSIGGFFSRFISIQNKLNKIEKDKKNDI